MRMLERRNEPVPEIGLALRADAIDQAGLVFERQRAGWKRTVGARGLAPRDFDIDRFDQARAIGGRSELRPVEAGRRGLAVKTDHEERDRGALHQREVTAVDRLEQRE